MNQTKPELRLSKTNGNSLAILAKAKRVAREHDMDFDKIADEATSGDHDHFLQTMHKYFEVV